MSSSQVLGNLRDVGGILNLRNPFMLYSKFNLKANLGIFRQNIHGLCTKVVLMYAIGSENMWDMSRLWNGLEMCREILYFSGIINYLSEYTINR